MTSEDGLCAVVIDRLITASLRNVTSAREASLQNWRSVKSSINNV